MVYTKLQSHKIAELCGIIKNIVMKAFRLVCLAVTLLGTTAYSQIKNSKTMTNTTIVKTFLEGFNNPEKLPESLTLLADNYHFKDPIMEHHSKAEFIESAKELGKVLTGVEVLRIAESGSWVGVSYNFKSNIQGLENNIGSEWFRIENGKIQESELVFDATKWRKVFAEMKH